MDTTANRYRNFGVVLMLMGAILFSTKAIFIKLAYNYEVSSISLLGLRMAFALPFFLVIGYLNGRKDKKRPPLSWQDRVIIVALGLCGYYLASYMDFLGLQFLSAGMERLILFIYPTIVLLLGGIAFGRKILKIQWVATAITYLGLAISFSTSDFSTGSNFTRGAVLIFGSAITYAIFLVGSGQLAPRLGSIRFTSAAMTAAAIGVLTHAAVVQAPLFSLATPVYYYAFAIAIIATVIPSYLFTEGIRRIGAGDAAILGAVGPVATIVLEYLVLEETLEGVQWIGAALVIAGVVIIGRNKQRQV
jgi:drug/metabolite transporter (DMT)-like permease